MDKLSNWLGNQPEIVILGKNTFGKKKKILFSNIVEKKNIPKHQKLLKNHKKIHLNHNFLFLDQGQKKKSDLDFFFLILKLFLMFWNKYFFLHFFDKKFVFFNQFFFDLGPKKKYDLDVLFCDF